MSGYRVKLSLAAGTGLLGWKWRRLRPGLYVFNFHRIGNDLVDSFDPNVFSVSAEGFARLIEVIAGHFRIIGLQELLEIVESYRELDRPLAMITFDDGYRDNYTVAFDVLKSQNLTAVFFLPTDFIGNEKLPWWERVAWMLNNSSVAEIMLPGMTAPLTIDRFAMKESIRLVLRYFKDYRGISLEEKLEALTDQCGCSSSDLESVELFMSWQQVKAMSDQGMEIGSHTCSHRILSHLSGEEQLNELTQSKRLIESRIDSRVDSLAYPVGGIDTYTSVTQRLVRQAGYKVAFSFPKNGAVAEHPASRPLDIPRISIVGDQQLRDLQYSAAFATRV